jgi:CBS domain containing-hemolysin-like protein
MDNWIIVIITLLLSAFFSGIEIAFISSNRLKIEVDKSRGLFSAKIISAFAQKPSKFIGALLLGNNIALVIYGIAIAKILKPWLVNNLPEQISDEFIILFLQTLIATIFILITAEFIPKILFRIRPNTILNFFALPIFLFYIVFYPFVFIFIGFSEQVLKKLFRVKFNFTKYSFSPIDLGDYIKEFTNGENEESEIQQDIQIFQNAIDFRNVKLRECMIPRTEIIALDELEKIDNLKQAFIETGHSKILIYNNSIDNIIGYTHSFDIFKKPEKIESILKSIIIVPETMLANKVLSMMIKEQKSVAAVVDEFGGTSGMITMEDIIEEIIGEIEDEHDIEELTEKKLSDHEFIFAGRLEIDYLNKKYNLNIPELEEYETLAGFIIYYHESIPKSGDIITVENFDFKIIKAEDNKIELVKLSIQN